MLTDTEKAGLVEELAYAMEGYEPEGGYLTYHQVANACLPIITRLLAERDEMIIANAYNSGYQAAVAERDLDALLDSVGGEITETGEWPSGGYEATIVVMTGTHGMDDSQYTEFHGTGPTRTAAVQAAVKSTKEAQGD